MTYSIFSLFSFFIFSLLAIVITGKASKRTQGVIAHLAAIGVAAFFGLRDSSVGADTLEYVSRFENETVTHDFLFSYIGIVLKWAGANDSQYLFTLALITSLALLHAIRNFTDNYITASLFLLLAACLPYGIMQYVNIARQGLAVAIILYGASLLAKKSSLPGLLTVSSTLFIHRSTALIYIISFATKRLIASKYGLIIVFLTISVTFTVFSYLHEIIAIFDQDLANQFRAYLDVDTSESPFLIYLKLLWAIFHLVIIVNLNKIRKIPSNLFYYYILVVLAAISLAPSALISTRILASIDFILPVLYALPTQEKGEGLRKLGIASLILYAILSPFVFGMYPTTFNW